MGLWAGGRLFNLRVLLVVGGWDLDRASVVLLDIDSSRNEDGAGGDNGLAWLRDSLALFSNGVILLLDFGHGVRCVGSDRISCFNKAWVRYDSHDTFCPQQI